MVTKTKMGYKCSICGKFFPRDTLALSCEQEHDVIFVPLIREDLFKLLQFIITRDDELLSESLMNTLRKYSRGRYT
jgi:hypothetical protein